MEKNGRSAYYWLRMAEENSSELRQRTRALTEELESKIRAEELETLEHSVMAVVEHNGRPPSGPWNSSSGARLLRPCE